MVSVPRGACIFLWVMQGNFSNTAPFKEQHIAANKKSSQIKKKKTQTSLAIHRLHLSRIKGIHKLIEILLDGRDHVYNSGYALLISMMT